MKLSFRLGLSEAVPAGVFRAPAGESLPVPAFCRVRARARPSSDSLDPATLQCSGADNDSCLTSPQVGTLRALYAGPIRISLVSRRAVESSCSRLFRVPGMGHCGGGELHCTEGKH